MVRKPSRDGIVGMGSGLSAALDSGREVERRLYLVGFYDSFAEKCVLGIWVAHRSAMVSRGRVPSDAAKEMLA